MYILALAVTLLAASTTAQKLVVTNTNSFGAMLKRGETILRRQGYTPDTSYCGKGSTCEEACGANQVECLSSDTSMLYCHDSTDGSACCPDGSGNACQSGYYCTSDSSGSTYCCPEGIDTANCATQYSLTVSLVRQTVTIMPSATPLASTVNAEDLVSTPSSHASDVVSTRTPAGATKPGTTVTTSTLSQVTGGAGKTVNVGAAAVAGVVGLVGFL